MPDRADLEPVTRLFVYGTLAPGRSNAHVLATLSGRWEVAEVSGYLFPDGCEGSYGYPALILPGSEGETPDPESVPRAAGRLFVSADLPAYWPELDAFEGPAYRRVRVPVWGADSGNVDAFVYELKPQAGVLDEY